MIKFTTPNKTSLSNIIKIGLTPIISKSYGYNEITYGYNLCSSDAYKSSYIKYPGKFNYLNFN